MMHDGILKEESEHEKWMREQKEAFRMNPWVLDLCSGLGGASEAFVKDPYWDVVRIENNPELAHVPHTESLDVLEWMDWLPCLFDSMGKPDLVIAAPPCREFSRAFSAPAPCAERLGIRFEPDMRILEAH